MLQILPFVVTVVHLINQTEQYLLAALLGEIYFGLLGKFFSMHWRFCRLESYLWYLVMVSAERFLSCAFLQNPWFLRSLLAISSVL